MASIIRPPAGTARYYLFNSMLQARHAGMPFALNDSDGPNLDCEFSKIDGLVSWEFTAYYLRVVYWPLTVTDDKLAQLDKLVVDALRARTTTSHELFPYASDKHVYPYSLEGVEITPSATLPRSRQRGATDKELGESQQAAGFGPDKFSKKSSSPESHRRVYDLCKNSYEHGESVPIVELDGGEYDRNAFRNLVAPLEEELMLLKGVIGARIVREQVEITYQAGLPLEVLDHFVGGVMGRFKARTEDDKSIFYQLKKGSPISLFIRPRQACAC